MFNLYKQALNESADYCRLEKNVRDGVSPISVFGVSEGQKNHIASALAEGRHVLYITQGTLNAERAKRDYDFYTGGNAVIFPEREYVVGAEFLSDTVQAKRIEALNDILNGAEFTVTTNDAVLFNLMKPEMLKRLRIEIESGKTVDIKELTKKLVLCGYKSVNQLENKGDFFVHGGIVDIFPINLDYSVRIDFFDNEIDSIRIVDPVSQRSTERIGKIVILPIKEICTDEEGCKNAAQLLLNEITKQKNIKDRERLITINETFLPIIEKLKNGIYPSQADRLMPYFYPEYTSLLDYMPEDTVVIFDEPKLAKEHSANLEYEFNLGIADLIEQGKAFQHHSYVFIGFERFWNNARKKTLVCMQTISGTLPDADARSIFRFEGRAMQAFHNKAEFLMQEVRMYQKLDYRIIICAGTEARRDRIEKELTENGIASLPMKRADKQIDFGQLALIVGSVSKGYVYPLLKLAVIAENDVFTQSKQASKPKTASKKKGIDTFVELKPGDYVVHDTKGIAIYKGIVQLTVDKIKRDYLFLQYGDEDRLYVAVEQMNRVQKYIAPDDKPPKLSKLGTPDWERTKARVRKSIEDMTDKLLTLYRQREQSTGIRFLPDTPWQREFEEDFQFEETPDQIRCINEIKADMESPKVMDRLLCGDVGYGKTEVAFRAMFKAVMSGKQAAILAPTTILTQQHYNTLKARLANFEAVRVEMLSRFKTAKEQKKTLDDLKDGKVDIVVGTHKLLGKEVEFKDLGLLVVDEEQRFGVAHKEKIKQLKSNIDVLTLSATPIPRTLNMALSGIRDMSLLETPPLERYPVQTYVLEYSDSVVRDAINRELQRGGQVYYLYNRVQSIDAFAEKLKKLVPEARIAIGHGQMDPSYLEEVIIDFYNGEYDVLLSTTIIENGVDIPGANTIIVQDAHTFGLSQLYQLRGRVGRSNRLAYAYFTVPKASGLNEDAQKRLNALEEFTQMGSGFRIAMRDLEIRGAGNLLGGEQHGHMSKIGYDLYCKMIKEAVEEKMGKKQKEKRFAVIDLKMDTFLGAEYIPSESARFNTYRKISDIATLEDMLDIRDELMDCYGKIPPCAENLLTIAYIRGITADTGIVAIKDEKDAIAVVIENPELNVISNVMAHFKGKCAARSKKNLEILLKTAFTENSEKLSLLRQFVEDFNENMMK